jgi:hypothetical protein
MFCVRANIGLGRHAVVIRTDDGRLRSLEHATFLEQAIAFEQTTPTSPDRMTPGQDLIIAGSNDQ